MVEKPLKRFDTYCPRALAQGWNRGLSITILKANSCSKMKLLKLLKLLKHMKQHWWMQLFLQQGLQHLPHILRHNAGAFGSRVNTILLV